MPGRDMTGEDHERNEDYPVLNGQVIFQFGPKQLSSLLQQMGVKSRVGESSHHTGGCYLHIKQGQAQLRFDKVETSEYSVSGDAPSIEELNQLAQSTSTALQRLALMHRFEIYFPYEQSILVGYFHYSWPLIENRIESRHA